MRLWSERRIAINRIAEEIEEEKMSDKDKSTNVDKIVQNNGFTKREFLILKPFVKEPCKEFTLAEIKATTGNKSHHYIFEALKKFSNSGVITEKKRGNTNIYAINPENRDPQCLISVEHLLKEERTDIPYENVRQIMAKVGSPFYILIIGGSYAGGKQKPNSDLDVAFIIPDSEGSEGKRQYQVALKGGELMIPEIHGHVFTRNEFYQMLTNGEFNFGKELARKHILCHGEESYYEILFEAMKNGFKG